MQTFLPYPDFEETARCLDYRRLGKQRVEAMQILNVLQGKRTGWASHPAVTMWRGCEAMLAAYMNAMIAEWIERGYRNTMRTSRLRRGKRPSWLGDAAFHDSHRASLLRKDPTHYGQFGWSVDPSLPYVWPSP